MPKTRLEAFSDGVIAIVITLLVLEIHIPDVSHAVTMKDVLFALRPLVPSFILYIVSFLVCAVWWVAHHNLIHDLESVDRKFLWANISFLLWLALLPLPTALLGRNPSQPLLCAIYGINCFLTGLSFSWMRIYAIRASLFRTATSPEVLNKRLRRSILSPALYFVGSATAWIDSRIALTIFTALPIYFALAHIMSD